MFTCQGYSTQQAGGYGILVKFAVNNSTIKEYEDVTGTKISYGLFAVLETKLGEGDAFDKSGNAINGTISTDLTKYSFDLIEFKITGINKHSYGRIYFRKRWRKYCDNLHTSRGWHIKRKIQLCFI